MKKLFTLLVMLVSAGSTSFAQSIVWGTPITVTTGAAANLHPRVALNRAGNPYVLWGQSDTKAFFAKWNGTGGFTTPVTVSGPINVFAQSWAGPDIAAFGDTIYVSVKRTPETMAMNHMYLIHSYDGGTTFSDTVRIDNFDTNMSRFPIVTTTDNGNPVVAFMKFNGMFMDAQYAVFRSADYGQSFSGSALASITPGEVCDCCPAAIISSDTTVAVLFRNNLSNIRDIWVGLSRNSGITFYNNRVVDTTNWMIMSCPSSGPDGFIKGDTLYSVFMSAASGMPRVYFSKTSISGSTSTTSHSPLTGAVSGLTSQNFPRMANIGSSAIAVWKQTTSTANNISYAYTTNIAGGLSGYTAIPGTTGSGVINADVVMTANAVHVVWQDDNTNTVKYIKGTTTPVGIAPVASKEKVSIYPNPAKDNITVAVSVNSVRQAYLLDNLGKKIELDAVMKNGRPTFSLIGIAKGNYFFLMQDSEGKGYYSKLIID